MRILTLSLSFVLIGCAAPARYDRERATLHAQIGTGFLAKGQYPQAMTELLQAEKLNPEDPQIQNALGLSYYVRGRWPAAEARYRAALKLAPDYSEAKGNLARLYIDTGRVTEAITLLHEVEADLTYQNQDKTFAQLGMAYFANGQMPKAQEYLVRSLQINRDNCTAASYYGRTLQELKRWSQSAVALDQAVEYCRTIKFEDPLYYSAMSYFSLGNHEKSRARLEELLKDYPQSKYVAKAKGMLGLLEQ